VIDPHEITRAVDETIAQTGARRSYLQIHMHPRLRATLERQLTREQTLLGGYTSLHIAGIPIITDATVPPDQIIIREA
jgi:hypothetical protein